MSIGVVMFWKAVLLSLWTAWVARWRSMKRAEIERGLEMRPGKDGVFRPYSKLDELERIARKAFWAIFIPWNIFAFAFTALWLGLLPAEPFLHFQTALGGGG